MTNTTPFKAGAVQAEPVWLDVEGGVGKAVSLIEEAASAGCQLLGFPETWVPGYPHFMWLGSQAWGMQFVQRYHENSIVVGDPAYERLRGAAARNNITVVFGASERDRGSLYMAQFAFGADGRVKRPGFRRGLVG